MTREEAIKLIDTHTVCFYNEIDSPTLQALHLAIEALSAESVQLKQTDTLIIADALKYLALDTERHLSDRTRADALREQFLKYGASMCHSADTVATIQTGQTYGKSAYIKELAEVVRCKDCKWKTMYYKDNESFYCDRTGIINMHIEDGDDEFWCKYGERREP